MDRVTGYECLKKINTQGEILTLLTLMSRLSLTSVEPASFTRRRKRNYLVVEKARCRTRGMKIEEVDCKFSIKGKQGKKFQFCSKAAKTRVPAN